MNSRKPIRPVLVSALLIGLPAVHGQAPAPDQDSAAIFGESTASTELAATRRGRDALIAAADFSAALEPAERSSELAALLEEPDRYNDLMHLARIQSELGQYEKAETNYLAAIAMLEDSEGLNSPLLIGPYHGLGRSYINNRRFPEAITVLEHARDISQRDTGLFNIEQSELIDDITMAQIGQGNTREARELQLRRLENAVRRFGADDPRTAPFYQHLGEYYDSSRLRVSAREQYRKALAIQESQGGDPAAVLESLRKLTQIELLLGDGDEAKLLLEQTLNANVDAQPIDRGLSLAVLGDYALVREDLESAASNYAQAYAALRQQDAVSADDYFAQPAMIDFIPPLNAVDLGRRSDPYAWGTITIVFDVNPAGRVEQIHNVQMEPAADAESAYARRLRETHFRPRLEAGVPAATSSVEFSHYFRYYVRERRRR
jgi:tetratricopeptide (TPR) repeat protein